MNSEHRFNDPPEQDEPQFDWQLPRWRDSDALPGDVERERRLKGNVAPHQRGAIDDGESVPRSASSR